MFSGHYFYIAICIHIASILNIHVYTYTYFCFQHKFILKNAQFILESTMSKIESMYKEKGATFPRALTEVNAEYRRLKSVAKSLGRS
jgi:hypothetical protein